VADVGSWYNLRELKESDRGSEYNLRELKKMTTSDENDSTNIAGEASSNCRLYRQEDNMTDKTLITKALKLVVEKKPSSPPQGMVVVRIKACDDGMEADTVSLTTAHGLCDSGMEADTVGTTGGQYDR
jgi:hypothetical protein